MEVCSRKCGEKRTVKRELSRYTKVQEKRKGPLDRKFSNSHDIKRSRNSRRNIVISA